MPPDEITFADVVSVLPFNNVWWRLSWAASSFCRCWRRTAQSPAGYARAGEWNVARTGNPIRPDETYHVLVNDFMYAGGDDYRMLARFDPQAYNTAIDWRQPVIDWILAQASSPAAPLDSAFAALAQ